MCLIKNIVYWLNFVLMLAKKGGYTSCAFQTSSDMHQPDLIKYGRLLINLRRVRSMIDTAINHIASSTNQYLMRVFDLHEDVVVVSNILEQDGTVATHVDNKIVVSLVNIEKDSLPLVQQNIRSSSASRVPDTNLPIHFNLYLMFASYFSGGNYQEGLKFLSNLISYFKGQRSE